MTTNNRAYLNTDESIVLILVKLIDKYERSNLSNQSSPSSLRKISLKVIDIFTSYEDHSDYETFSNVNSALDFLKINDYIISENKTSRFHKKIVLNLEQVDAIYKFLDRKPKSIELSEILEIIKKYENSCDVLHKYSQNMKERIKENKPVQYYNSNLTDYENLLKSIPAILNIKSETYEKDFSAKIFKDSKQFDKVRSRVISMLFDYLDLPEKETVLPTFNLFKTPTYVNFKGNAIININDQIINLKSLNSDIAISSKILPQIQQVIIPENLVVTIENLTTFHSFQLEGAFIIYLGGFHNSIRKDLLKLIYQQNPHAEFLHHGDIDAGGFQIYKHLCSNTKIEFKTYKMNLATLQNNTNNTKPLTDNDTIRLTKMLQDTDFKPFHELIAYMIEHNCKLEQEHI